MAWALFLVPSEKRAELDAALKDDTVSRQSQTVRDAAAAGGPAGALYVLIEGADGAVAHARSLLGPLAKPIEAADAEALYRKFKADEENASAGMGLFFTE
ncbi:MAG TPA: hypothetical protein VLX64_05315 [Thermoplasmata archaeon]|nr:hypothetical protein [Thermoplasmata archaeon]HUJ78411.1 hypothetical protein [Thermoplasmata archaeon]